MGDEAEEDTCGCFDCCKPDPHEDSIILHDKEHGGKTLDRHPVMDRDRGVTDWYATIVFAAMFVSTFLLWCCAFAYGQPEVATHGMAWNGNICGRGDTSDAPQQVWINPTMTSSIFASSVCMPSCPTINSTAVVHNDTATADLIEDGINQIGSSAEKKTAQNALNKLERRVKNLKTEVSYLNSHIGDSKYELDRRNMYCLCNAKKFPTFHKYNLLYNIKDLCNSSKASARGYIELPYQDELSQFVGDGKNLALDSKAMDSVPCAFRYRTSKAFTRCLPWISASSLGKITMVQSTAGIGDVASSQFNAWSQRAVNVMSDIETGAGVVTLSCFIAFSASIFLIWFMSCEIERCCKVLTFVVWGTLISLLLALIGVTGVCAYQANYYTDRVNTTPELTTKSEDEQAMYLFIVSASITGFMALCHLIFMCPCVCGNEIQNSIQIIAAAAAVFKKTWGLLFYPIFHNLAVFIAGLCWFIGLVFIGTAGKLETNDDGVHTLVYNEDMQRVIVYYVFCIVWIVEWMGAMGFMVVTGAILIAFFDNDRLHGDEHETRFPRPLFSSFKLVTCYHMGTAAIGSFFITLVVMIKWFLTYLAEKIGKVGEAAEEADSAGGCLAWIGSCVSAPLRWLSLCVNCCCQCIEDCIRYMERKAYILTVLEGRWFFSAVCGGLSVVIDNISQIMTTSSIAFVLLWLCKLAVPLGTTFFAHLMIQGGTLGVTQNDLSSAFNILVPVFLISCVFSFTFMGLLDTSIEVCLVAFCKLEEIDEEHPELNVMNAVPEDISECFTDLREKVKDANMAENQTDAGAPLLSGKEKDLEAPAGGKDQETKEEED